MPPTPSASMQKAPVRRETLSNRPDAAPSTSACQIRERGWRSHSAEGALAFGGATRKERSHLVAPRGISGFERPPVVIRGHHSHQHQWSSEAPSEAISRGHHAPRPLFGSPDLIRRNRPRRNRRRAHLWGRGEGAVVSACLVGDEPVGGRTRKNSSTNAHGNQRQSTTINGNQRHSGARTEELEHAAAELVQEGQWVEEELDRSDELIPSKLGQEGGHPKLGQEGGHRGRHQRQSSCNQHAITWASCTTGARRSSRHQRQSACNQHEISMQSA
jgi:hypothetical protein